jgi:site-specific recombinase XerD
LRQTIIWETQESNMSLDLLITQFLEYLEIQKGCSPLSIRQYRHYLKRFHNWLTENSPTTRPDEINLNLIRRYRLYLAHLRNRDGLLLQRITQSYHIVALRAFLRYLLVQRDIPTLSPDKVELPKQGSRSVAFLNAEQIERLLSSPKIASNAGLRDKTILETLFSTGLRVSELVNLNRDQIDLERKEFGVKGKGNKLRVVFLSDTAAQWIERYLRTRKDNFKPLFIRYSGKRDAQKNGEEMRLTARSVERIVAKYAKRAGLPINVTPHTLRHSFATDLLISGADIRSVQEMLGHESIRTTQVYTHVTNRHLKEVHKAFHSKNRQS